MSDVAIITGSAGLVGSECVRLFAGKGMDVFGIDNDERARLFGYEASTADTLGALESEVKGYHHHSLNIRIKEHVGRVFDDLGNKIKVVIHAAAQPSHDLAGRFPDIDFETNAAGTFNVLECARLRCPDAVFIFTSTNKVYGDRPNHHVVAEGPARYELVPDLRKPVADGFDETMRVDQCTHSLFGASKLAADILVQEYGRYFGMKTAVFRAGCITGAAHAGAELHGFLAYLVKCCKEGKPYTIYGCDGKQVRDNIHAADLANAFWHCYQNPPTPGEVYNIGGGRERSCSVREAIATVERMTGKTMDVTYNPEARKGDHIWWISDVRKFRGLYPEWDYLYDLDAIFEDLLK